MLHVSVRASASAVPAKQRKINTIFCSRSQFVVVGRICLRSHVRLSGRVSRYPLRSACHGISRWPVSSAYGIASALAILARICTHSLFKHENECVPHYEVPFRCVAWSLVSLRRSYDYVHFIFSNGTRLRIRCGEIKLVIYQLLHRWKCALKMLWPAKIQRFVPKRAWSGFRPQENRIYFCWFQSISLRILFCFRLLFNEHSSAHRPARSSDGSMILFRVQIMLHNSTENEAIVVALAATQLVISFTLGAVARCTMPMSTARMHATLTLQWAAAQPMRRAWGSMVLHTNTI